MTNHTPKNKQAKENGQWTAHPLQVQKSSGGLWFWLAGGFILLLILILLMIGVSGFLDQKPAPLGNATIVPLKTIASNQQNNELQQFPATWTAAPQEQNNTGQSQQAATQVFTRIGTITPYPSAAPFTRENASESSSAQIDEWKYAQVDLRKFMQYQDVYVGKMLKLSGQVINFGEIEQDSRLVFGVQLIPLDSKTNEFHHPVLVLNMPPDPRITLKTYISLFVTVAENNEGLWMQGYFSTDPYLIADSYEILD